MWKKVILEKYKLTAMRKIFLTALTASIVLVFSCENRDINEGEAFKPKEIHENILFNFDKVKVDGVEYLILEKDNNNPHEGFGFMAFRANNLLKQQDSILAMLKTIKDLQVQTYSQLSQKSPEIVEHETEQLFQYYLNGYQSDLTDMNANTLSGISTHPTTENKINNEEE